MKNDHVHFMPHFCKTICKISRYTLCAAISEMRN